MGLLKLVFMYNGNFKSGIFLCFLVPVFMGCASLSTMQTARVTEKGKFDYLVDYGSAYYADMPPNHCPVAEFGLRYGITDYLDVGYKISISSISTLDFKYQFLGDKKSKFAGSIGLGGGIAMGMGDGATAFTYDTMLPVYFSYHPNDWLSLYCSPKYIIYRKDISLEFEETTTTITHFYGATAGIRIGKRVAFLAEYSLFGNYPAEIGILSSQITCGLAFCFYK